MALELAQQFRRFLVLGKFMDGHPLYDRTLCADFTAADAAQGHRGLFLNSIM